MQGNEFFFETPDSIACIAIDRLEEIVKKKEYNNVSILDLCSGHGKLAFSSINKLKEKVKNIVLIDHDQDLLDFSRKNEPESKSEIEYIKCDAFSEKAERIIKKANIILCNPPYQGFSKCSEVNKEIIRKYQFGRSLDFATAFVMQIVKKAKEGAILVFIIRRDMLFGKAYSGFVEKLNSKLDIEDVILNSGRVFGRSGSTESAILFGVRSNNPKKSIENFEINNHPKNWVKLGDIANVVSGPNTGNDKKFLDCGDEKAIRMQPSLEYNVLWSKNRLQQIHWSPKLFSNRRNIRYEGLPGVVYRLTGAKFICSVLPAGVFFCQGAQQ